MCATVAAVEAGRMLVLWWWWWW